ncbi:hypothetical protein BGW36DRAFT_386258 [Talaromyces proteolyticus]|uniref:Uncharacterized protein n=1 Tax=Talaromyces proteolyticus TaxID=1131652 RepID=A0AAD4KJX0_9EURO|nr:uncharacterized protein BGW36DRAFT_386258 [Talaromyces proteolyticus]KAH8693274.1 hypothetical protein BGW36DRAFT_386258 [Talaromyces proteolyticus]
MLRQGNKMFFVLNTLLMSQKVRILPYQLLAGSQEPNMYIPKPVAKFPRLQTPDSSSTMSNFLPNISLDAAGLITLAEITVVAERTALTGTSIYADSLVLCPGFHRQQSAPELNGGEFPAVAAMTTGYVFRVENSATVTFLKRHGKTGQLVTVEVLPPKDIHNNKFDNVCLTRLLDYIGACFHVEMATLIPHLLYWSAAIASLAILGLFVYIQEWWGVFCLLVLMFSRFCNVWVIRQRAKNMGWKGASEPGVHGDLLILMGGDCWIRMQGAVDDLKAVTSGQWLRDRTSLEEFLTALSTVLVYINAALVSNICTFGQLVLLLLFIFSAALLFLSNATTTAMKMYGRTIQVKGPPRQYLRRRDMADELIRESNRKDWARRLGLIVDDDDTSQSPVVM